MKRESESLLIGKSPGRWTYSNTNTG